MASVSRNTVDELFSGGGEMGALMRSFDWESTPLGPPEQWSLALQMMVRMLLANSFPILLWWGPDFIQLYNDAYIPVLGKKHPHSALGKPFRECWSEVYHVLGPLAETPYRGGPPTWIEDIPVELFRHGYPEEAHFTISYSPVSDTTAPSGIGGVVAIVHEISSKVVADRRILALRDLGSQSVELNRAEDAYLAAASILASYPKDIPFCLVYLIDETEEIAHLAGKAGFEESTNAGMVPDAIQLSGSSEGWPLVSCLQSESVVLVEDLERRFTKIPQGPWADPPNQSAIVPIKSTRAHQLAGFLIVGISSRLQFDEAYRTFLELASAQISIVVANARTYELELKRNEALAEIDRAKTAFFTNISHEFRTPLTLLLGPIEDALARPNGLTAQEREPLESAHRNALRLLKLVNALLDFSRIEAGRAEASFEAIDLAQFVSDLASVFRSTVERAGLKLTVDCEPISSPVYIDRAAFEKILFNLLSNAFKFTFEGEITVSLRAKDASAEITVSDTGTGIPEEEIPELFRRFHRVRGARGRSYEGSGIGLALVQDLVKLHGGSIRIESELNRGSRFIVSIPLGSSHLPANWIRKAGTAEDPPHVAESYLQEVQRWLANSAEQNLGMPSNQSIEPTETNLSKELVVIADDNADMREYISRILKDRYRVETSRDGSEALEAVRNLRPDLVLADVMMPVLDGFGLLSAIRNTPELSAIPVILLSARAGEESRVEGVLAGADDYMVKPFSAKELIARVESSLALSRLRRQSEKEIRESEERFRAFVAASSDVIYRMSPDWETMWHLDGREFIASTESPDQSWMDKYILPEDEPAVRSAIKHAVQNKSVFQLEHQVRRADGSVGWTFSRAIPLLNADGVIIEWFGAAADITARKNSERALLQTERLASVGRMAASIAHEINNPLEALSNLIYLAMTSENVPQAVSERLAQADLELRRVAHITRQSLGFYRETSTPTDTDVNALVESAVDLLRSKIDQKNIVIEKKWNKTCHVRGVAGELRQVFSNLLANSIDAVDQNGRIVLRISECAMNDDHPSVLIIFADNGKGIDPTSKTRIFEPLYTTKGTVGTGLGLWVTKEIIDKHQGSIRMHSSNRPPHLGTVFGVFIPK